MIILTTSTNAQELKFIPRYYASDYIVLTDEETNTSTNIDATFSKDSYYLKSNISLSLKKDKFYTFKVYKSALSDFVERVTNDNGTIEAQNCIQTDINKVLVYNGRIFCTDQKVSDYSINKNVYTEHQSSNEYIFYNE
jgi:hypothetical protein